MGAGDALFVPPGCSLVSSAPWRGPRGADLCGHIIWAPCLPTSTGFEQLWHWWGARGPLPCRAMVVWACLSSRASGLQYRLCPSPLNPGVSCVGPRVLPSPRAPHPQRISAETPFVLPAQPLLSEWSLLSVASVLTRQSYRSCHK